ncbi:YheC/YheD family protein [Clostridium swellfunianum]|uniref:YheC/YheD family endospore coat-associated protein n=1 Tax=Clostridium swellfunianum TaxID=1367462 RepID=UPI00202E6095|nr:YheC/YheD family protein [Clostridium swellfunianum]
MHVITKKLSINTHLNTCLLPRNIFNSLNLSTETIYTFHFGLSISTCSIGFLETDDNIMYVSEGLLNSLNLFQGAATNIWRKDTSIYLGPVIGILFHREYIRSLLKGSFNYFAVEHTNASLSENCICYYFSPLDIDWKNKRVKGIVYTPELKKCDTYWLPLPNILYDRISSINRNRNSLIARTRRKFKNTPGVKLINSLNVLGKLETYEALVKYTKTKDYLPETIIYSSFNDAIRMLNKNNLIFIKSCYGFGGREVLSIEKACDKYKLNYYHRGPQEIISNNINEVQELVTKFVSNKKFIIQRGINLLKYKGSNMDIRIFVMKNQFGSWESIFKGARIAKQDFRMTNTHAGGVYAMYEQIYDELVEHYELTRIPSPEKLNLISTMLASYIEKKMGKFGEIGLDIGIDLDGAVWLIEANSKPDKELEHDILDINGSPWVKLVPKFYTGTMNNENIQPQALGIFKYAKFLSGTYEE